MKNVNKGARTHTSALLTDFFSNTTPEDKEQAKNKVLVAVKINEFLQENNWTNKQLANASGKSESEVVRWLSGTHNFTIDTLSIIAFAFNKRLSAFFETKAVPVIPMTVTQRIPGETGHTTLDSFYYTNELGILCNTVRVTAASKEFQAKSGT